MRCDSEYNDYNESPRFASTLPCGVYVVVVKCRVSVGIQRPRQRCLRALQQTLATWANEDDGGGGAGRVYLLLLQ